MSLLLMKGPNVLKGIERPKTFMKIVLPNLSTKMQDLLINIKLIPFNIEITDKVIIKA